MTRGWYEPYAGCTSVTRALRGVCAKGWVSPESVKSQITGLCKCWLCEAWFAKLGKGLGQPERAGHDCLGIASVGG